MSVKLNSQELSDVIIESLVLASALLERFETMDQNGLFVQRAKQSIRTAIPHIEEYVSKLITPKEENEIDHFKKGATVVNELSARVEKALGMNNILDISNRKQYLKEFIEETTLFPVQKTELYEKIRNSGILDY
jgi:chaperonin GroEL (HSP60 family)